VRSYFRRLWLERSDLGAPVQGSACLPAYSYKLSIPVSPILQDCKNSKKGLKLNNLIHFLPSKTDFCTMKKISIGLLREGKVPPDHRVPLIPEHCAQLLQQYDQLEILVQPSSIRCIPDIEYTNAGCIVQEDLSNCDMLMGVKEVPIDQLIPDKTYLFFSHTIKKQAYNRGLLQAMLKKHIRMIDYEVMTFENGKRAVAFGHFAGVVGTHNGLRAYGMRTGAFSIKPAHACKDYAELRSLYTGINLPPLKITVTGTGRVGAGALEMLHLAGVKPVTIEEFLFQSFDEAVFVELRSKDMYRHKHNRPFESSHFHTFPGEYVSIFEPFTSVTDLLINTIYWDPSAPVFFSKDDMKSADFSIKTIADITCDIDGSIPSTIRSSSIDNPFYGYDPLTALETTPFSAGVVDVMAVDNLPCELPKDASREFSYNLIQYVMDQLITTPNSAMINRATICIDGKLSSKFEYLEDYIAV